jgi:hypothetical protein
LAYAAAYPDEVAAAIADSAALNRGVAALVAARGVSGAPRDEPRAAPTCVPRRQPPAARSGDRAHRTYDSATLPLDAYALLDAGAPLAGAPVVTRAIGQRDGGGQARAVLRAIEGRSDLIDQVIYLQVAQP